jgi:hypothetical protein
MRLEKIVYKSLMFCTSHQILVWLRMMRWAWHVVHIEERRNVYNVLMGEHEGKRPLGRHGCG